MTCQIQVKYARLGIIYLPTRQHLISANTYFHPSTYSLTHIPTHSLTYPLTHSHTHSLTHIPTHSPTYPLTHPHTHSLTHVPTHSPTYPLTRPHTHSLAHIPTHPLTSVSQLLEKRILAFTSTAERVVGGESEPSEVVRVELQQLESKWSTFHRQVGSTEKNIELSIEFFKHVQQVMWL